MAELLSGISVLLVFLVYLLNEIQKSVNEKVSKKMPPQIQCEARKQFTKELLEILLLKAIPVTLVYIVVFYSLLPKVFHIFSISQFSFWYFDELNTIFVFIELGLLGLTIFSVIKVVQLILKYREKNI